MTQALRHSLGAAAIGIAHEALMLAAIIGTAAWRCTFGWHGMRPVAREVLKKQILFTGVQALPFTALLAVLTAAIVVVQSQFIAIATQGFLAKIFAATIVRELGPLLVAFIVIGRSGTAIAAELAHMRVAHEIDTLEANGIDPFEYLIVPRMAGMVAAMFSLACIFVVVAVVGGFLGASLFVPGAVGFNEQLHAIAAQLSWIDAAAFLAKTVVPGFLIAAIACTEGLRCGASVNEVPRAATAGVVKALSVVFVWNAVVSVLVFTV